MDDEAARQLILLGILFGISLFVAITYLASRPSEPLPERRREPAPRDDVHVSPVMAPPPTAGSISGHNERACPYCKDTLAPGSVHLECAACGTWHHATCFEENQGCSVFGCREKRGVGRVRG